MADVLSRIELYASVWKHPVGQLARRMNITSATLRDACKVMSIPLPPLGHWQRTPKPTPTPLPPHDGPDTYPTRVPQRELLAKAVTSTPREAKATEPGPPPKAASPRYVTLDQWAVSMFGEHKPHFNTLRKWVNEGRIQPQPKKMGIRWWVVPAAEYVGD